MKLWIITLHELNSVLNNESGCFLFRGRRRPVGDSTTSKSIYLEVRDCDIRV